MLCQDGCSQLEGDVTDELIDNDAVVSAAKPDAYIVIAMGSYDHHPTDEDITNSLRHIEERTGFKGHVVTDPVVRFGITKELVDKLDLLP